MEETGEEKEFDTISQCREWADLVQRTFDNSIRFLVREITEREISLWE